MILMIIWETIQYLVSGHNITNLQHRRVHAGIRQELDNMQSDWRTLCVHMPNRYHYYGSLFSKIKTKHNDADVLGWIFGHLSLLKPKKDVEDDNRYSMLPIDIISSRKYCD